jgi:tetratricopeptide (TPR) repeat protein
LLGDLLLDAQKPAEALAAFEAVLAASPNRLNSLYGAGLASERSGDKAKAQDYYRQVLTVASDADERLDRVEHARTFLANFQATRAGE